VFDLLVGIAQNDDGIITTARQLELVGIGAFGRLAFNLCWLKYLLSMNERL